MEKQNKNNTPTDIAEDFISTKLLSGDNGKDNGKKVKSTTNFDIKKYKKNWFANLDRRFLSIFFVSLCFNVIMILYLSSIPFQITADYVRKFQEHYANFVYDKQPEPVVEEQVGDQGIMGESKKDENTEDESGSGGGEEIADNSGSGGGGATETSAETRRAARSRSTDEIAQEVSSKGLLGLLTGSGSAAKGEAIQDVLGTASMGGGTGNLDDVLSGISGIKTSGAPGGSNGGSGGGGARGGRTAGSGTGIGDMIDGLTSARSTNFGRKTNKIVVSESKIEAEAGKSAGRDPESVMAVVNSHRAAIEYCYQRALRKNPNLKGKISLKFIITPSGSIKNVIILSSTLNDPSVEKCIIAKIKSWRDFGPIEASKGDAVFRQDYIFGY